MSLIDVKLKTTSYSTNVSSYLAEIDNVTLITIAPIDICRPMTGDAWDLCLKISVPGFDEPMHVFIDNKSMDENQNSSLKELHDVVAKKQESGQAIVAADLYDEGKQYYHMERVMGHRKLYYIFILQRIPLIAFILRTILSWEEKIPPIFLGPLSNLYQIGRSTSTEKKRKEKGLKAGNDIGTVINM